ncbi:MAG: restriction system protein, partial [Chloroflexia bacterium]|nr:restriction system protein [Chloroflexia bacterium]
VLLDAGVPLRPAEIAQRMIDQQLWQTQGLTPGATIDARLSVDIRDNGKISKFQRTQPGVFALRSWGLPEYTRIAKDTESEASDESPDELPDSVEELITTSGKEHVAPIAQTISFTDAAEQVLNQYGSKVPMHYRDITRKAIDLGLISTRGQTPDQTMYAQILTEIDRYKKRGEVARFTKEGRGLVGLSKWIDVGLAHQIEQTNSQVKKALRNRLYGMTPKAFEDLIGALLVKIGFDNVEITGRSGDGGIDVRGTLVVGGVIRTRMAVQAKRWKNNVQAPIVQQVRGSLGAHEQGLIITTSDYSSGARTEAERPDAIPVALMNGHQLVDLLIEHDIGIRRSTYDLIELSDLAEEQ